MNIVTIIISALALVISALTAWFSLFRNGTIKMTQPTMFFFGPDGATGPTKIFLRTLLFSTAMKGHIVENMYVKLQRGESAQNFNIWVYGDRDTLARGSGLFISKEGIACNHHFLLPKDGTSFIFFQGEYTLKVFATLLGKAHPILLFTQNLSLSKEFADHLNSKQAGIYFDWGPDSKSYFPYLEKRPDWRDALDELTGEDYERAIEQLTPEQQELYLSDPNLPIEKFMRIRNKQERKKG